MTTRPLILGTAGHIDHGKTALVKALTGVDTDRLEEEKKRGISIDIGFAHLDLDGLPLGIVDVPGHEKFIRNMLAGASGIDLALLAIAADDSVMPQTREHLAILELLRIEQGVIALTKCDLSEASWIDLVEEEIRDLVKGTFLENAPIVRTSATTGKGIDELKTTLAELTSKAAHRVNGDFFRLPIDRAFVLTGLGTVVTGTVWSGQAQVNEELELLPEGKAVKVRSLQSHGHDAQGVCRGQRAAINLMGAHHSEIERGCELAVPGFLKPSKLLTIQLRALESTPRPIKHRAHVRLHVGTQEIMAELRLLETNTLEPGQTGFAQLIADEPVVASGQQPFVIRAESPLHTLGGGRVLLPNASRLSRRDSSTIAKLADLACTDESTRARAAIFFMGHHPWTMTDLCRDAKLDLDRAHQLVGEFKSGGELITLTLPTRAERCVQAQAMGELKDLVTSALRKLHEDAPLEKAIPRQRLTMKLDFLPEDIVLGVANYLIADGDLVGNERTVALPEFQPKLSQAQRRLRELVLKSYREGAFSPPEPKAIAREAGIDDAKLKPILDLCAAERTLVHVEGSLFLHIDWHEEWTSRLTTALTNKEGLAMSEIKTLLDTSRKYAIPICEHLDKIGITQRRGDVRVLKNPQPTG
ncbi:MAG: selenocysteine-specific translation elongation factor [Planctomycetota bacterium]|nr:selenocysteine-specific translation elongation factor [Planctomycetota bacterium]